jgi:predicted nucleotidyltransferase
VTAQNDKKAEELRALAEILAEWVDDVPGVTAVYLFGSRVRGDHDSDSDIDVRLYLDEWDVCNATTKWWTEQNKTDFAALKARLPGPLSIHREKDDAADIDIRKGSQEPVPVVRKVVCVWTPPRSGKAVATRDGA